MNAFYYNQRLSARILAAVALFSLVASLVPTQAFAATNIATAGFESNAELNTWNAGNAWSSSNNAQFGTKSAFLKSGNAGQTMRKTLSTVGYENVNLSFWFEAEDLEWSTAGGFDKVEAAYTLNGSTWVEFTQIDGDNSDDIDDNETWKQVTFNPPAGADNNPNFALRFKGDLNGGNDKVWIDGLVVSGDVVGPAPLDTDADGIPDSTDNCDTTSNPTQTDTDNDSIGNACEADTDGDTVIDDIDNCDTVVNLDQADTDNDGVGNACEVAPDADNDTIPDAIDNCVNKANPDQADNDNDDIGNVCDPTPNGDNDNDGVDNDLDNCPNDANSNQTDTDDDGVGDACDDTPNGDTDGDGVDNEDDNCPLNPNADQTDTDDDGVGDACDDTPNGDTDGDGEDDNSDNCPSVANADQIDTDSDGSGDACDTTPNGDDDVDGVDNETDNCPAVANPGQTDTDDDGTGDACEPIVDNDADDDGVNDDVDNCVNRANSDQADNDNDDIGNVCDSTPDGDGGGDPELCTNRAAQNYGDEGSCVSYTPAVCVDPTNRLVNNSFEPPTPTLNSGQWEIFPSILGWTSTNGIEIWNNLLNGPSEGTQNVELDTSAPSTISQPVTTIPGATYELRFDFAARSDASSAANNSILASADTNPVVAVSTDNTAWVTYGSTFIATDTSTDITFADMGTTVGEQALGYGTLLDNAKLCLVSNPDDDDDEDTYRVSGYIWYDNDRNGDWEGRNDENQDEGEEELAGWTMKISNGDTNYTATTDEDGYYYFDVPAGTWTISGDNLPNRWFSTTNESITIEVGDETESTTFLDSVMDFLVPVAYAQVPDDYPNNDFGYDRRSGGDGGGSNNNDDDDQDGNVLGASDSPKPLVLGDQVSAVPAGAPNTGKGGAATVVLGQFLVLPRRRNV